MLDPIVRRDGGDRGPVAPLEFALVKSQIAAFIAVIPPEQRFGRERCFIEKTDFSTSGQRLGNLHVQISVLLRKITDLLRSLLLANPHDFAPDAATSVDAQ